MRLLPCSHWNRCAGTGQRSRRTRSATSRYEALLEYLEGRRLPSVPAAGHAPKGPDTAIVADNNQNLGDSTPPDSTPGKSKVTIGDSTPPVTPPDSTPPTPSPAAQHGGGPGDHGNQGDQSGTITSLSGQGGKDNGSPGGSTASNDTSQVKSNPGPASPDSILGPAPATEGKNSGDSTRSDRANESATENPPLPVSLSGQTPLPTNPPPRTVVEQEWGADQVRLNQGDVLNRVRWWNTRLAAGTASIIRSMWEATEDAAETGSPQETEVLAESLPFDPAALDRTIEPYLDQIDA